MADKIRWGILGCGRIAAKFADALRHVEGAELLAVGSRTDENAHTFGDAWQVRRRYGSYQQLAADPDLDVIYIATPHNLHAENAILCLNAGKHVLCEKPLAVNALQGQAMIDCARANKYFLMEAMWTRFLPLMDKVRQLLAEKVIGDVRMLFADFCFFDDDKAAHRRLYDPHLAGGTLLDVGVYPIALSSMIFGRPVQIHSAAAFEDTGVDTQNGMLLQFDKGQLAMLCSGVQAETPQEAVITGTGGIIRIHHAWWRSDTLTLIPQGKKEQVIEVPSHDNGFVYEIQAVHKDLSQGRLENALMPLAESLEILKTMDTIRSQWGFKYPFESE